MVCAGFYELADAKIEALRAAIELVEKDLESRKPLPLQYANVEHLIKCAKAMVE